MFHNAKTKKRCGMGSREYFIHTKKSNNTCAVLYSWCTWISNKTCVFNSTVFLCSVICKIIRGTFNTTSIKSFHVSGDQGDAGPRGPPGIGRQGPPGAQGPQGTKTIMRCDVCFILVFSYIYWDTKGTGLSLLAPVIK